MALFKDFQLSPELLNAVEIMGFEETTPIQEKGIPIIKQNKDMIGQAQTGTGKTACFGIPLLESINSNDERLESVILTPTRELAVQVAEELNRIGQFKRIYCLPIYGGQDINRQIRALKKKPQVIVATPGRLMDHMERRTIRFGDVRTVILDEADEMLDMGFIEDIEHILEAMPPQRQTLLFSATMPRKIQELAQKFMKDPELVLTKPQELTVPEIEQNYIEVKEKEKFDVLCRLLDTQTPPLAIIFGRTKRRVDELSEALAKRGYSAEGIHGDLTQARRESVLRKFKQGVIEILVATDVAARGLDISGVTHVYNFDIPQDAESYVHRIGRTGRAGKSGLAVTFVTPRELDHLNMIKRIIKVQIIRKPVPTFDEVFEGQKIITRDNLVQVIEDNNYTGYKAFAESLLEEYDSVTLLAAALKILTKEPDYTPVQLTEERPVMSKKSRDDGGRRDNYRSKNKGGGYRGRHDSRRYDGPKPNDGKYSDRSQDKKFDKKKGSDKKYSDRKYHDEPVAKARDEKPFYSNNKINKKKNNYRLEVE